MRRIYKILLMIALVLSPFWVLGQAPDSIPGTLPELDPVLKEQFDTIRNANYQSLDVWENITNIEDFLRQVSTPDSNIEDSNLPVLDPNSGELNPAIQSSFDQIRQASFYNQEIENILNQVEISLRNTYVNSSATNSFLNSVNETGIQLLNDIQNASGNEIHPAVRSQLDLMRASPYFTPEMENQMTQLEGVLKLIAPVVEDTGEYGFGNFVQMPPGIEEQASFDINQENPAPYQTVSIRANVYSTDLDKAKITWLVDDKIVNSGIGLRDFQLNMGNVGETSIVKVLIQKAEGGSLEKTLTFTPAKVDILQEAETYTPPFYKGRALYGVESSVRFIAQTNFWENGKKIPDTELIYRWKKDGKIINEKSGYGKNIVVIEGGIIDRDGKISVEVSSVNSKIKAQNSIKIKPVRPEVWVYEDDPLLGIRFENVVKEGQIINKDEITLFASPYYFSFFSPNDGKAEYDWKINSQKIFVPLNQNKVTFRNSNSSSGESLISVNLKNTKTLLQSARNSLSIIYGENIKNFDF